MKLTIKIFLFLLVVGIAACYEENNFFEDNNVTQTGKAVPFVYLYPLDSATFRPGVQTRLLLEFWCNDPLKEIRLYESKGTSATAGTRTLINTTPYKAAFSQLRQMDTLVFQYTIPSGNPANTQFWLHGEGVSQKDVTKGTWVAPTASRTFRAR